MTWNTQYSQCLSKSTLVTFHHPSLIKKNICTAAAVFLLDFFRNSQQAFVIWNFHHFLDGLVVTGRYSDSCLVWTFIYDWSPVFSDEQQRFLCQPLSAVYFPFSASLWGRTREEERGVMGGGRVMGGGLLPSICCDGRLGSPEGASAWPDRNHHWSVWHQASPQLRVAIGLLVDPQRVELCSHCSWQTHTHSPRPRRHVSVHRVYARDNTWSPHIWKHRGREDDGRQREVLRSLSSDTTV